MFATPSSNFIQHQSTARKLEAIFISSRYNVVPNKIASVFLDRLDCLALINSPHKANCYYSGIGFDLVDGFRALECHLSPLIAGLEKASSDLLESSIYSVAGKGPNPSSSQQSCHTHPFLMWYCTFPRNGSIKMHKKSSSGFPRHFTIRVISFFDDPDPFVKMKAWENEFWLTIRFHRD